MPPPDGSLIFEKLKRCSKNVESFLRGDGISATLDSTTHARHRFCGCEKRESKNRPKNGAIQAYIPNS
jgi:hypothetical protein